MEAVLSKQQKIYEELRIKIYGGVFAAGVKLPSENELALQHGVTRKTLRKVLELLEKECLIERSPRTGTVVLPLSLQFRPITLLTPFPGYEWKISSEAFSNWEALSYGISQMAANLHRELEVICMYRDANCRELNHPSLNLLNQFSAVIICGSYFYPIFRLLREKNCLVVLVGNDLESNDVYGFLPIKADVHSLFSGLSSSGMTSPRISIMPASQRVAAASVQYYSSITRHLSRRALEIELQDYFSVSTSLRSNDFEQLGLQACARLQAHNKQPNSNAISTPKGKSVTMKRWIFAPQWSGNADHCSGTWNQKGAILKRDQSWEEGQTLSIFPSTVLQVENLTRFYYHISTAMSDQYNLALAEIDKNGKQHKHLLLRDQEGYYTLAGLQSHLMPVQANVFQLGPENWRMYFWAHYHGVPRQVRFMAAESENGRNWRIANNGQSIMRHPSDISCVSGDWPTMLQCNDATTVYRRPDHTWEMFSASIVHVSPDHPHHDSGVLRMIQRWESADGWNWSGPEVQFLPDKDDQADLQFYYLSKYQQPNYSWGILGRYSEVTRRLEMEPIFSSDHRQWQRTTRRHMLKADGPFDYMTTAAHQILTDGDQIKLYYTAFNFRHLAEHPENQEELSHECDSQIFEAEIDRRHLFGRAVKTGQTVISPAVRLLNPHLRLYCRPESVFTLTFLDSFGMVPADAAVQCRSSDRAEVIDFDVPTTLLNKIVRLQLSGDGEFYDLEY